MQELRANTQVKVKIGPAVAVGDGFTPVTTLDLSTADEAELFKHDAAAVTSISAATFAAITSADGWYNLTLTTSHTDTEGLLDVIINDDSLILPLCKQFMVLSEAAWDSKYVAKDDGFMDVNIKTIGRADTQETEATNLEAACAAYSATRGLSGTALPAAAADAAGGLPISDAGGLDLDAKIGALTFTVANVLDVNTLRVGGTVQTGADVGGIVSSGTHGNAALKTLIDTGNSHTDTEIGALQADVTSILADTNEVQISLAAGGLIESMVDDLQTEVDGIQADTEDIQSRLPAALGANGNLKADVRDWIGTAVATPTVAGVPEVDATHMAGTTAGVSELKAMGEENSDTGLNVRVQGLSIDRITIGSTGNTTTTIHAPGWTYGNDEINHHLIVIFDASEGEYHSRWVEDWVLATELITVATLPFTPQNAFDTVYLFAVRRDAMALGADAVNSTSLAASAVTEIQSGLATSSAQTTAQTDLTAILADTNELQGDWVNGGRLDLLLDATLADTNELQTDWANGGRLDLIIDSLATASALSSLVTTVGAAGAGLTEAGGDGDQFTAIVWNAAWDAEVQSECTDALNAYDPPTQTENLAAHATTDAAIAGVPVALLDLAAGVETGLTLRQAMRLLAAASAGKLSGAATTTIVIRNAVADSKDRITATVDADGNRSAITVDLT